eukprot:IDg2037t1
MPQPQHSNKRNPQRGEEEHPTEAPTLYIVDEIVELIQNPDSPEGHFLYKVKWREKSSPPANLDESMEDYNLNNYAGDTLKRLRPKHPPEDKVHGKKMQNGHFIRNTHTVEDMIPRYPAGFGRKRRRWRKTTPNNRHGEYSYPNDWQAK